MIKLQVPFFSQWDILANLSKDDCGPACINQILNYYGEQTTINDVFTKTGAPKDSLISISQMQKAIKAYGYESYYEIGKTWDDCRNLLNQNTPIILLIHYGPLSSRQDKNYYGGHFIVLTGEDNDCWLVNDPDFWNDYRQDGEQHRYLKNEMELAWAQCNKDGNPPYSYLVIKRKGDNTGYYKGIDLTNIASLKVCIDAWKDLVDNKYVLKSKYEEDIITFKQDIEKQTQLAVKWQGEYENFNKIIAQKLNTSQSEPDIESEIDKMIKMEDDCRENHLKKIINLEEEIKKLKESGNTTVVVKHSKLCKLLAWLHL